MKGISRSFLVALWFMFLTFPIMVIKVSPLDGSIAWRWENSIYVGISIFFLAFVWRGLLVRKGLTTAKEADLEWLFNLLSHPRSFDLIAGTFFIAIGTIPLGISVYSLGLAGFTAALGALAVSTWLAVIFFGIMAYFSVATFSGNRKKVLHTGSTAVQKVTAPGMLRNILVVAMLGVLVTMPFMMDIYRVNVLSSALIWIMLGLGLNIVVGQTGLLVLGYAAFYAVGAYTYAIANANFGGDFFGFWICLPLGGFLALLAGVLLSLPVLRLRGDYLAIVTLGFGEIVRVILESGSLSLEPIISLFPDGVAAALPAWMSKSLDLGGPAGISGIPYPGFFGMQLSMDDSIRYVYFIALALTVITIISVSRLRDSRIGRSWMALREDEIACEAMGINNVVAKLSAFAIGACWAGFGGVLFASKTSFINPTSFTFMESALILSVVVLGGLGSILGVILGACVLILLPEYLRAVDEYRMLIFGASMVLMMVFRPQGLIVPKAKRRYIPQAKKDEQAAAAQQEQVGVI